MHRVLGLFTLGALALFVVLGSTVTRASAAPPNAKIGFIDFQRTFNETKAGKAAKAKLESDKNQKQGQLNQKKDQLQKDADEFQKQRVVLKPDAAAKREDDLRKQFSDLQQLYMQLQQDLAKQEATAMQDIVHKAGNIIESIAKRDGYTLIVEKQGVVWADKTVDITDEVDKRLDAGEGSK